MTSGFDHLPDGPYADRYRRSIYDPEGFWGEAAGLIDWTVPPERVLDASDPPFFRWFGGGRLNVCHNAVDRHVAAGRGDQAAVIYDSPITGTKRTITYRELLDEVATFAGALRDMGVEAGDRVLIYMPMIPQAVVAMLATARLGAIHSVVFGGFAAMELVARIDDARPKVIVSASCGIEPSRVVEYKPMLDEALRRAQHPPERVVVFQREEAIAPLQEGRDIDWNDAVAGAEPAECVDVAATDPLYILYTSGTTGTPKGIVRDAGGGAVSLAWSMPSIYTMQPGETMFTASDVGWVVGHSYIVYGPLLIGAITVLFEGKPVGVPDAGTFWRVVAEHGASVMFTAPTAIRAIRRDDPDGELIAAHDTSSLRKLFLAGERLDPDTYHWITWKLGVPVIDNWWQTETGWPIASNPCGIQKLPIKPGSPTVPSPGYRVEILDADGTPLPANAEGSVCIRLPLPPGNLPTLWENDQRYIDGYLAAHDGYYLTGDGGYLDEDGYLFIMGRIDDVINVAGHRLSTGELEATLATHPAVAECCVIGVADRMKGQVPRGFVVVKSGQDIAPDALVKECVALVRAEVGAVASLNRIDVVAALPKTRSGKILRKTMREIADGEVPHIPSTIEDVAVLDALRPVLES